MHIQKFSFGEIYRRICIGQSRFTTPLTCHRKTKFLTVYPTIYLPKENFEYSYPLTVSSLYIWMNSSIQIGTIRFNNYIVFLSLKIVFILLITTFC